MHIIAVVAHLPADKSVKDSRTHTNRTEAYLKKNKNKWHCCAGVGNLFVFTFCNIVFLVFHVSHLEVLWVQEGRV